MKQNRKHNPKQDEPYEKRYIWHNEDFEIEHDTINGDDDLWEDLGNGGRRKRPAPVYDFELARLLGI